MREENYLLMQNKGKVIFELKDKKWLHDLALLVDLTTHLNN